MPHVQQKSKMINTIFVLVALVLSVLLGCGKSPVDDVASSHHEPIWEISATSDSVDRWREMRIQRQGSEEVINFRAVSKGTVGFVYGIYLYGTDELTAFSEVLSKFSELVDKRKTDPLNASKQKIGQTRIHEFWFAIDGSKPVLEFSDPKNTIRGGMSMIGEETVDKFQLLQNKYESKSQMLDELQEAAKGN